MRKDPRKNEEMRPEKGTRSITWRRSARGFLNNFWVLVNHLFRFSKSRFGFHYNRRGRFIKTVFCFRNLFCKTSVFGNICPSWNMFGCRWGSLGALLGALSGGPPGAKLADIHQQIGSRISGSPSEAETSPLGASWGVPGARSGAPAGAATGFPWAPLGFMFGHCGSILRLRLPIEGEAVRGQNTLFVCCGQIGCLGGVLDKPRGHAEPSGGGPGASWRHVGGNVEPCWAILSHLDGCLGRRKPSWKHFWQNNENLTPRGPPPDPGEGAEGEANSSPKGEKGGWNNKLPETPCALRAGGTWDSSERLSGRIRRGTRKGGARRDADSSRLVGVSWEAPRGLLGGIPKPLWASWGRIGGLRGVCGALWGGS